MSLLPETIVVIYKLIDWMPVSHSNGWCKYIDRQRIISREGDGNPLRYPCLETPMGGGAW